jgi:RNA polymerase sigma factor (sigma-70 family)
LTSEELDALLRALGPDREKAGEQYESIRRKLVRLFEWRGCPFPEDLTDEAFNRVARQIARGVEPHDLFAYFCGVAHLVHKETLRRQGREHQALESALKTDVWPPAQDDETDVDDRLEALRGCLQALSPDQRRLVLLYHQDENHIRSRKTLSDELGLPMNALRIRVHRIRRKLEECVAEKLQN